MRGMGGLRPATCGVSSNEYSSAHHLTWRPNKLWRSTSIFNLCSVDCSYLWKTWQRQMSKDDPHVLLFVFKKLWPAAVRSYNAQVLSASGAGPRCRVIAEINSFINPFLFIRGLSCPSCIQASLSLNCHKLTIPGFPSQLSSCVSCGDTGFKKKS
jgi:hypothetical protein